MRVNPGFCRRSGKLIGGCKFEPRYDLVEPGTHLEMLFMEGQNLATLHQKKVTYVRDVCVRCGTTIEREK